MSATTIKDFVVGLGFQVDESSLKKFTSMLSSSSVAVAAIGTATVAAAGMIVSFVQGVASSYDQLDKLATQFRASAGAIDEFIDTAKILGVSDEESIGSLKNLDRAIVDTSMGLGRAKLVFADLGISVTDAAGKIKPTTEVMAELSEKFKGMERGKQLRVMERLGLDSKMLKVFNGDLVAISADLEAIDKAADFNFDAAISESKSFTLSWRKMQQEVEKWKMLFSKALESIAVKLMPKFRASIKTITDSMVTFRAKVMDAMPGIIAAVMPIIDIVMRVAEAFVKIVGRVIGAVGIIIGWIVKANNATDGWAGYILAAAAAWKYLNLSFLKSPLGMFLALAAAVALLVDDFLTWSEGGESLIDWGSNFGTVMAVITGALSSFLAYLALTKIAVAATTIATEAWGAATAVVNGIMGAASAAVTMFNLVLAANPIGLVIAAIVALIAAGALLIANWDTVKNWFSGFFDFLSRGFDKIKAIGSTIAGVFGGGGTQTVTAPRPGVLAPSPQAAAAVTGGSQNVNQQTQIVVQGAGNPDATARAVAGQQNRVNADMARNMAGATR